MLPENASDMVDRLSEKAQRSKVEEAVPDLGLFYKYVVHWSF